MYENCFTITQKLYHNLFQMLHKNRIEAKIPTLLERFYEVLYFSIDDYIDINYFMDSLDDEDKDKFLNLWKLFNALREFYQIAAEGNLMKADHRRKKLISHYENYNNIKCSNTIFPFDDLLNIKHIALNETVILPSSSYPIKFRMLLSNNEYKDILYKYGCHLTNDMLMLKIVKFLRNLLNLKIKTYEVIPLSPFDGIVQIVENLGLIPFTSMFYNSNNQSNFTQSISFYLALSYVFGIGDRHMNNVVLQSDGNIIYVDYDYLLGTDPKIYSEFSLPTQIKTIINEYKLETVIIDSVGYILNRIRMHKNRILSFIRLEISDPRYPMRYIDLADYVNEKLMIEINLEQFSSIVKSRILKSFDSYAGDINSLISGLAGLLRK